MSVIIGVERIASVCPKSTSQAVLASSPVMILRVLLPESLVIITPNNSPKPHLSMAAGVVVILAEKSAITDPYASAPSMSSVATQFMVGESMMPNSVTLSTLPSPGPPFGP